MKINKAVMKHRVIWRWAIKRSENHDLAGSL